jgi:hypothetical protein
MDYRNDKSSTNEENDKPFFLITIDTEPDNLWSKHKNITTRNADFLPRFQSLCESYGFKPTYLTDYEMANSPSFQDFGRNIIKQKTGEIGMHLHAWNTPPLKPLTKNDFANQPYLIEYPEEIIREKISTLTSQLKDIFRVNIVSHRAGRWSFNEVYAKILVEHGYLIDCSVTPYVSWRYRMGDPNKNGGTDYTNFPDKCYFLDLNNISQPGNSTLLEVPVTIIPRKKPSKDINNQIIHQKFRHFLYTQLMFSRWFPPEHWLRLGYARRSIKDVLWIINQAIMEERIYVEFMLHSFDLMPGGNPSFTKEKHIDGLYRDLKLLFETIHGRFRPATLADYYKRYSH